MAFKTGFLSLSAVPLVRSDKAWQFLLVQQTKPGRQLESTNICRVSENNSYTGDVLLAPGIPHSF